MGFTFLILLWPLFLGVLLLDLIGMALPVISAVLLVWNLLVLAVLLVIRHFWAASGTMSRSYIDPLSGWKRVVLLIARYGLLALIVWEVLLALACAALMVWGQAWLWALISL